MMKKHILAAMIVSSGMGLMAAAPAQAGATLWVPPSACTGINCASNVLNSNITSSSSLNGMEPFVVQLMGAPGDCTRLDLVSQNTDLELTVISPNGTVWRNDDRTAGDLRPLIVIPAGNVAGWYTVQISRYNGVAPTPGAHYDGMLQYGRYNGAGNPNCANPTPPAAVSATTKP